MESTHPTRIKDIFTHAKWRDSLIAASVLLFVAYLLEHFANIYAFTYTLRPTTTAVGDIFLDNIPAIDLNFIIIESAFIIIIVGTLFVLHRPRHILFTLKALALFVSIRAICISLTHIGIYPDHIVPGLGFFDTVYRYLNFQTGLFFSGHTGLPFLLALIFWKEKRIRIIFLMISAVFGTAVLLAHVHYSIDVFAAPFMAYGIFKISQKLFPHDYKLIEPSS